MKRLCIGLLAIALAAGCGDDSTAGNNGDTNNTTNMDSGTNPNDMGSTPTDMGSDPTDMGEQPVDMATADMDNESDAGVEMDMAMEVDMGAPYDWPATAGEFIATADRVSYISTFGVPAVVNGSPECCRDFGAISSNAGIDNSFSLLNNQLSQIPGSGIDFQAALNDALTGGDLVFLLDHRELDGADDADGFLLSWLDGNFAAGTIYTDAAAGTGAFDVRASSFVGTTGEPARVMNRASMNNSVMAGGPISIDVILPFGAASIPVPIEDMNATATATIAVDSVTYTMGELSGYIPEDEVFIGINSIASSATCGCLGLNGADLYTEDANGNWSGSCQDVAACADPSEFPCRVIAGGSIVDGQVCTVLPGIIQNSADIDSDGDGTYDALSIGLTWDAVNATLQ